LKNRIQNLEIALAAHSDGDLIRDKDLQITNFENLNAKLEKDFEEIKEKFMKSEETVKEKDVLLLDERTLTEELKDKMKIQESSYEELKLETADIKKKLETKEKL